jgi:hypothetical protein
MNKKTIEEYIQKLYAAANLEDRKSISVYIREIYNIGFYDGQDDFQQILEESIASFGAVEAPEIDADDDSEEDDEDDNLKWS